VDADGAVLGRHDKVRLLPFAEYAPWPFAGRWLGIAPSTPGAAPRTLRWREVGLGPLVCYEVLFPGLARRLAREGSGILVNLANDSWFGATGAAEQHLAAAMYRAIETRRPILRATHSGITAGIDARGRIAAGLPPDVAATLALDVRPGSAVSPYVRWGDAPVWLAAMAAVAAARVRLRAWPPSSGSSSSSA
jgi:apolipoprotein N-acyltransferase